jgi:hypothetical protein
MATTNGEIDVNRIIGEVASRHGFLVHPTDPAFALVTINQLVLEESMQRVSGDIGRRILQFDASIQQLEQRAGKAVAQEVSKITAEMRQELSEEIQTLIANACQRSQYLPQDRNRVVMLRYIMVGVVSGLVFFSAGVLIGMARHSF